MTDEANDDWMKPGPPDPWPRFRWRFLGCLLVGPLEWICGLLLPGALRPLPDALLPFLMYLPVWLWLLCLIAFCSNRFWRDPRPLWGRLAIGGPGWARYAWRVLATLLTFVLGLPVFVLVVLILAIPFAGGHAP